MGKKQIPVIDLEDSQSYAPKKCPICLEKTVNCVVKKCGHEFCFTCIRKWSKNKFTCPVCRGCMLEIVKNNVSFPVRCQPKPVSATVRRRIRILGRVPNFAPLPMVQSPLLEYMPFPMGMPVFYPATSPMMYFNSPVNPRLEQLKWQMLQLNMSRAGMMGLPRIPQQFN